MSPSLSSPPDHENPSVAQNSLSNSEVDIRLDRTNESFSEPPYLPGASRSRSEDLESAADGFVPQGEVHHWRDFLRSNPPPRVIKALCHLLDWDEGARLQLWELWSILGQAHSTKAVMYFCERLVDLTPEMWHLVRMLPSSTKFTELSAELRRRAEFSRNVGRVPQPAHSDQDMPLFLRQSSTRGFDLSETRDEETTYRATYSSPSKTTGTKRKQASEGSHGRRVREYTGPVWPCIVPNCNHKHEGFSSEARVRNHISSKHIPWTKTLEGQAWEKRLFSRPQVPPPEQSDIHSLNPSPRPRARSFESMSATVAGAGHHLPAPGGLIPRKLLSPEAARSQARNQSMNHLRHQHQSGSITQRTTSLARTRSSPPKISPLPRTQQPSDSAPQANTFYLPGTNQPPAMPSNSFINSSPGLSATSMQATIAPDLPFSDIQTFSWHPPFWSTPNEGFLTPSNFTTPQIPSSSQGSQYASMPQTPYQPIPDQPSAQQQFFGSQFQSAQNQDQASAQQQQYPPHPQFPPNQTDSSAQQQVSHLHRQFLPYNPYGP